MAKSTVTHFFDSVANNCTKVYNLHTNNTTLECGPMHNVMAALTNIGGALCSMPQSLADAHYYSAVH